ncbi:MULTISPECIES: hypothetical protein [unclassified Gordonia (in: high G+C Gram-positive bacteria)]
MAPASVEPVPVELVSAELSSTDVFGPPSAAGIGAVGGVLNGVVGVSPPEPVLCPLGCGGFTGRGDGAAGAGRRALLVSSRRSAANFRRREKALVTADFPSPD